MPYAARIITHEPDLQAAFSVRRDVFVQEQGVPEDIEIDDFDISLETLHVLVIDEQELPVATGRFRPLGPNMCKVERIAVLPTHRNTGLGRMVMDFIESQAAHRGWFTLKLYAQVQAAGFYERLGYVPRGQVFEEAGLAHIEMRKNIKNTPT